VFVVGVGGGGGFGGVGCFVFWVVVGASRKEEKEERALELQEGGPKKGKTCEKKFHSNFRQADIRDTGGISDKTKFRMRGRREKGG